MTRELTSEEIIARIVRGNKEVLAENIKNEDTGIRIYCAVNCKDDLILDEMAKDESDDVLDYVANNPNTATLTLKRLAINKDSYVAMGAMTALLRKGATTEDIKQLLMSKNKKVVVRASEWLAKYGN